MREVNDWCGRSTVHLTNGFGMRTEREVVQSGQGECMLTGCGVVYTVEHIS